MNGWFDNRGFNNYYLGKTKYAKSRQLLDSFYHCWVELFGQGLNLTPMITHRLGKMWNASAKKKMKTRLLGIGYTSAGIDGLIITS